MNLSVTRIALLQLASLLYAIFFTAATCKAGSAVLQGGYSPPRAFVWAETFRDAGWCLALLVLAWTCLAAYSISPFCSHPASPRTVTWSGLGLAAAFIVCGTWFAASGLAPIFRF